MSSFGQYYNNDFDGSFLQSLSIDDTTKYNTPNIYNHEANEDEEDLMEIDNTYDLIGHQSDTDYHTPPIHVPETEDGSNIPESLTPITKLSNFITSPFQSTPLSNSAEGKLGYLKDKLFSKKYDKSPNYDKEESNQTLKQDNGELARNEENESSIQFSDKDHSSIVSTLSNSILSPTLLGAKVAMGRPKLLLPPPSPVSNTLHEPVDHEYDTSSFKNSEYVNTSDEHKLSNFSSTPELRNRFKNRRNISSFSSGLDPSTFFAKNIDIHDDTAEEYIYNPRNGNYDTYSNESSLNGNSLNQSYLYRKQHQALKSNPSDPRHVSFDSSITHNSSWMKRMPVQIHHHHYYYGDVTPSNNIKNDSFVADQSGMYISSNNQLELDNQDRQLIEKDEYKLPLPWESTSAPHERIPYLLSSYLQLIVNFIATCYTLYLIYTIIKAIRRDISHKLSQQTSNMLVEIASCKRSYIENNCSPESIVPALEKPCAYWLKCMNQDPFNGGNTSSISAETVGIIINSLVEPLGLKFFLILFSFIILIFACNFTFGFIRAKTYYGWDDSTQSTSHGSSSTEVNNTL